MQWLLPSAFGKEQPQASGQGVPPVGNVHGRAQLPLLRHCSAPEQARQAIDWPQLFVQKPQRPAQVAAGGSGTHAGGVFLFLRFLRFLRLAVAWSSGQGASERFLSGESPPGPRQTPPGSDMPAAGGAGLHRASINVGQNWLIPLTRKVAERTSRCR